MIMELIVCFLVPSESSVNRFLFETILKIYLSTVMQGGITVRKLDDSSLHIPRWKAKI